ncbi:MAG: ComF family protein [Bacteroidetes bacterium]|nr:ComF family protein [Bacteroidota bacterium]
MAITKKMLIFINRLTKNLTNFLFPKKCVSCSKENTWICEKCLKEIPFAERQENDFINSVWNYKDLKIKKLLWLLKFKKRFSVVEDIGEVLHDHFQDFIYEKEIWDNAQNIVLLPVPIGAKRLRKRGYNQSAIIAKELSKQNDKKFIIREDLLEKIKDGPPQNSIKNRRRRFENIRNSFRIKNENEIRGKSFIVIDDITTTGATISEIKKILNRAGAKNVFGFTIAH